MLAVNRHLQKEYCPPLDSSAFYSCFLDYAAEKVTLDELRRTLDILKEVTLATDDTAFDPSGTSGVHDGISSHESSERAKSWHGDASSDTTEDTEISSMSQALESVNLGANSEEDRRADGVDLNKEQFDKRNEELSFAEKVNGIKEIIPEAKDFDISYTLKKYHNNFHRALDDLLTQNFLDGPIDGEIIPSRKGIEAFMEPAMTRRERTAMKGKKKRESKQLLRRTSSTPKLETARDYHESSNQWLRVDDLVNFIQDRTYLSPKIIRSTYHSSGATLPSTIAALCTSKDPEIYSNPYLPDTSPATIEAHAQNLILEFAHSLQYHQAVALIKLTHPATTSAREMALALTSSPNVPSTSTITPHYILPPPSPPSSSQSSPSSSYVPLSQSRAATLALIRSNAHTQSRSASRKAKSDHLMGGAASYYNSVSRDVAATLRQDEAARADALVSSQSKAGEVDLHGLNLKDAVRVSRERVEAWWESEGREWARAGKVMNDGGLRIITGLGRHSAGGKAVLGPAVCKMLNTEGWRVQVGDGVVRVTGRARR